ncbi:MAG TPA: hypothetical protein VJG32_05795 [Anaerolineae bacterium]|nr:hypothetical protein [Anaerolineae bacterium]
MAPFIRVIEQFAVALYAACLIGVIWSIRAIWLAWHERKNTLFLLEREEASARIGRGLLSVLACLGLGAVVFVLTRFVAPALPIAEAPTPTPPGPLITLTPTNTPFPTPTLETTPTPEPSLDTSVTPVDTLPAVTPEPTTPPAPPAACPDPNVQITAPHDGDAFSGPFQIFGTANIPNFGFYKFVLNGPWTQYQDRTAGDVVRAPVSDSYLGTFDPAALLAAPGAYRFSLVVVDNVGNEAPHCSIAVQFLPPTPAPP